MIFLKKLIEFPGFLYKNFFLISVLTKKEFQSKYKNSILGLLWAFLIPTALFATYIFAFTFVFKAKWGINTNYDSFTFAFLIFIGLMTFNFFSESISRSINIIISNPSYVKKINFPLEILVFVNVISVLINYLITLFVFILIMFFYKDFSFLYIFLNMPLVLFFYFLLALGMSFIFSILGVIFKDISQIISLLITCLLFGSAVFYPVDIIPDKYQFIFQYNPIVLVIDLSRKIIFFQEIFSMMEYSIFFIEAIFVFVIGFIFFDIFKKNLADEI